MTHLKDTYTGGTHYWISYENGLYIVKREGMEKAHDEFYGTYTQCCAWLDKKREANAEYDLNI